MQSLLPAGLGRATAPPFAVVQPPKVTIFPFPPEQLVMFTPFAFAGCITDGLRSCCWSERGDRDPLSFGCLAKRAGGLGDVEFRQASDALNSDTAR